MPLMFQAAPPRSKYEDRVKWAEVREELRSHPGQWAMVRKSVKSQTSMVKRSLGEGFSIRQYSCDDGTFEVWASYTGAA